MSYSEHELAEERTVYVIGDQFFSFPVILR